MAKNCAASIDNKNGAEAKDWKKGVEVRVVRNCKGRKHSNYAPEEGNRYDGIYKVLFLCLVYSLLSKFTEFHETLQAFRYQYVDDPYFQVT